MSGLRSTNGVDDREGLYNVASELSSSNSKEGLIGILDRRELLTSGLASSLDTSGESASR